MRLHRKLFVRGLVAAVVAVGVSAASGGRSAPKAQPIGDAQLKALTTTIGGAKVLPTTRTIGPTLASPQFALNDYGSAPFATAPGSFPSAPR